MDTKVFKMNDIDWVCAESEIQAKQFYKKEAGLTDDEINEGYVGEVSLDDTMLVNFFGLPQEEKEMTQVKMRKIDGELLVYKPFSWVIEHEKISKPCIICSTDY